MKIYLKKINNEYLIEIEHYAGVTIEVDGKRFLGFKKGWIPQKPNLIQIVENKTRVISYGELKPEDHEVEIEKLIQKKDEDGYPIFENLDQEYAYKKFNENHIAVYEKYEEKTTPEIIEWEITGRMDNEFIIPFRFIGKVEANADNEPLYEYKPNPYKLAQAIAKELKLEEVYGEDTSGMKWCVPDHSKKDLQFTKIAGKYADYDSLPRFYNISCGTWNECEKAYNLHYNAIKNMFQKEIKRLNLEGKKYDKAKILERLNFLIGMIRKIDAKIKSDVKPHNVIIEINKLIDDL